MIRFVMIILIMSSSFAYSQTLKPKFKKVTLDEFTVMELKILPHAGTQLIFPFKLNDPDLLPEFKIKLTNADGFAIPETMQKLQAEVTNQNTISITGKASPNNDTYLANLFINIGGYNLSIGLKTTYKPSEHVSNIVFELNDSAREHLIDNKVKRRMAEIEREHKDRMSTIDDLAKKESLKYVALMTRLPEKKIRYKKKNIVDDNNNLLTIYVDNTTLYGKEFSVLKFEIKNDGGSPYKLNNIELAIVDDNSERTIDGALSCPEIIKSGESVICHYSSQNMIYQKSKLLKMTLISQTGATSIEW